MPAKRQTGRKAIGFVSGGMLHTVPETTKIDTSDFPTTNPSDRKPQEIPMKSKKEKRAETPSERSKLGEVIRAFQRMEFDCESSLTNARKCLFYVKVNSFNTHQMSKQNQYQLNYDQDTTFVRTDGTISINLKKLAIMPLLFDPDIMRTYFEHRYKFTISNKRKTWLNRMMLKCDKMYDRIHGLDTTQMQTETSTYQGEGILTSLSLVPIGSQQITDQNRREMTNPFTENNDWMSLRHTMAGYDKESLNSSKCFFGRYLRKDEIDKITQNYQGFAKQAMGDMLECLRFLSNHPDFALQYKDHTTGQSNFKTDWPWFLNGNAPEGYRMLDTREYSKNSIVTSNGRVITSTKDHIIRFDLKNFEGIEIPTLGPMKGMVIEIKVITNVLTTKPNVRNVTGGTASELPTDRKLLNQIVTIKIAYGKYTTPLDSDLNKVGFALKFSTCNMGAIVREKIITANKPVTKYMFPAGFLQVSSVSLCVHCIGNGMPFSLMVDCGRTDKKNRFFTQTSNSTLPASLQVHMNIAQYINNCLKSFERYPRVLEAITQFFSLFLIGDRHRIPIENFVTATDWNDLPIKHTPSGAEEERYEFQMPNDIEKLTKFQDQNDPDADMLKRFKVVEDGDPNPYMSMKNTCAALWHNKVKKQKNKLQPKQVIPISSQMTTSCKSDFHHGLIVLGTCRTIGQDEERASMVYVINPIAPNLYYNLNDLKVWSPATSEITVSYAKQPLQVRNTGPPFRYPHPGSFGAPMEYDPRLSPAAHEFKPNWEFKHDSGTATPLTSLSGVEPINLEEVEMLSKMHSMHDQFFRDL